jgi:hypothetical protein
MFSGDLEDGGAFMYGTGSELPGGDVIVPNGLKYIVDSMASNVQVSHSNVHNFYQLRRFYAHQ